MKKTIPLSLKPNYHVFHLFSIWFLLLICAQNTYCQDRHTEVTIVGEMFHINGVPTYEGKTWSTSYGGEYPVQGLLMNARLVQGVFDDLNPETKGQWIYPDTKIWDPFRNTQEFINAMASWREHGLLSFTLNLQGGCPYGYCRNQPWDNSAFSSDGSLRAGYMDRLQQVLDRADELGMIVILGYFYFGQDGNLENETAVIQAVKNATEWILEKDYRNVIIEVNNECNVRYDDHAILQCDRVHELIDLVSNMEYDGRTLYVSTSLGGGSVPPANIVEASDFIFLHGNGVSNPDRMEEMIQQVRGMEAYSPMPIVNNEDDQPWRVQDQDWGEVSNNFVVSVKNYASWGYFDFRLPEEHDNYNIGFQSVPVNWSVSSDRKREFFELLAEITGSPGTPEVQLEWSQKPGSGSVRIIGNLAVEQIEIVEVIVNNEVVSTPRAPGYEFRIEEIPDGEHWVKARIIYRNNDRQIQVESPYFRNPWWPYGGPSN
jgi:hypothetical protein